MTTKTITAMFNTQAEADQAATMLVSKLGLATSAIQKSPGAGITDAGYDKSNPYADKGFFGSLKDMFVPDEDRFTYAEGMRRGAALLNISIDDSKIEQASDVLEHAGAVDLDAQEESWRQTGWTGYDATAHQAVGVAPVAAMKTQATMAPAGQDETIKVVQERLVVGKRVVDSGRVKIRSYIVERPVEETVSLHQESVHVTRQPVDRVATAADLAAFGEKTIEARAMSEEVVVGKEARVVEEIAIHKDATDRSETIHETVRETKVDVDDTVTTTKATGVSGTSGTSGTTGVAGAVDRSLNTNASGTNPAADAPDGTPGNPAGTMVSRGVDKVLGTNVSGANPTGKL